MRGAFEVSALIATHPCSHGTSHGWCAAPAPQCTALLEEVHRALQAYGGIRHLNGYPDRAPVRANISLGDSLAGLHGAFGAVMALLHRQRGGRGASGQASNIGLRRSACTHQLMQLILQDWQCPVRILGLGLGRWGARQGCWLCMRLHRGGALHLEGSLLPMICNVKVHSVRGRREHGVCACMHQLQVQWRSLCLWIASKTVAGGRCGHLGELLQHAGLLRARVCQPRL